MKRKFSRRWKRKKGNEDDETLEALMIPPIHAFSLEIKCHKLPSLLPKGLLPKRYLLSPTAPICVEDSFTDLALGWSEEGVCVSVLVKTPFQQSFFPDVQKGDGLELFIDTRDVKNAGFNHRFCHHFAFAPKENGEVKAAEITQFRTEDSHKLCPEKELSASASFQEKSYTMNVWIPKQCLYGFDPDFARLGFTYRMNRFKSSPQHFCVHSNDLAVEYHSSLWSSVRCVA